MGTLANSEDPDEMQHDAAFHQGLNCLLRLKQPSGTCDFIWPFLPPYMGVILSPKIAFIFLISCILVLNFPIFMI